ncbi:hypothetical protein LINGRAPRIM_LOCUS2198 [Linum grandiflorum]
MPSLPPNSILFLWKEPFLGTVTTYYYPSLFQTSTSCLKFSPSSSSMASSLQLSASSTIVAKEDQGMETQSSGLVGKNDLLIVGPGVLGRLVADKWREEHPECEILGETVAEDHHEELRKLGIRPCLRGTTHQSSQRYPYIIFCAPPYRTADYHGDVREAALRWNGEGCFLFTSSSAPYDRNDNGECDEDTPVVPIGRSLRTDVLLKAEDVVLESEGSVVRLAGLYKSDRGAHVYWLEKGTIDLRPDHILNLIHYEDAASLCITILKKKLRGQIFLGCDNHPLSRYMNCFHFCFLLVYVKEEVVWILGPPSCKCKCRQKIMELVAKSGKFSKKFEGFTGMHASSYLFPENKTQRNKLFAVQHDYLNECRKQRSAG